MQTMMEPVNAWERARIFNETAFRMGIFMVDIVVSGKFQSAH